MQKAYQQFLKNPPSIYLEQHSHAGGNMCAEEDILPGTIVAEYLGEVKYQDPNQQTNASHRFDPFEADKMRGVGAMINDGFPNCATFTIPNVGGIINRVVLCATSKISKKSSIVYDYGINHPIKFNPHFELCDKEMTDFFKNYTSNDSNALVNAYQNGLANFQLAKTSSALLNSMNTMNRLFYLTSTPHAILKLVCDQTLSVEAIQLLFKVSPPPENLERAKAVSQFISLLQVFSAKLKGMNPEQAQQCRKKLLENLSSKNVGELMQVLKNPPQALLAQNKS